MSENYLLDAVDALTKPIVENHRQLTDEGVFLQVHTVQHPPLLQQIHDAVVPTAGNDAGSKSASSSERNMVDSDALFHYGRMAAAVWDWCRIARLQPTRDVVQDLRAWYVAHTTPAIREDDWYTRELRRWRGVIINHLDPPKRLDAGYPCPICGPHPWVDQDGNSQPNRLIIEYRLEDGDRIHQERTVCRNPDCNAVWDGLDAIKELGEELTERHARSA